MVARHYIMNSSDGLTWQFSSDPPMFVPRWADYVGGKFIGAGNTIYGTAGTSDDGVTWTAQDTSATGFTGSHTDATAGGGRFVVTGRNNQTFEGYIITTENGVDWTLGYSTGTDVATRGGPAPRG